VFWSAVRVDARPACWLARSWNAVIRRSASGSGPRTSSPARRRAYRRCSFSDNLGWHDTKPPSASSTNYARHGAAGPGPHRWSAEEHVEVDETWVGGRTRGEGRGIHHKTLVAAAVEVRHRKPGTAQDKRKDGRYAVECDCHRR